MKMSTLKKLFFSLCFYLFMPLMVIFKFTDYILVNHQNPLAFVIAIWTVSMISLSISMGDVQISGPSPMGYYSAVNNRDWLFYWMTSLAVVVAIASGRYLESSALMISAFSKAYYINTRRPDEKSFWNLATSLTGAVISAMVLFWAYQLPRMNGIIDWIMSAMAVVLIIFRVGYFLDRSKDIRF